MTKKDFTVVRLFFFFSSVKLFYCFTFDVEQRFTILKRHKHLQKTPKNIYSSLYHLTKADSVIWPNSSVFYNIMKLVNKQLPQCLYCNIILIVRNASPRCQSNKSFHFAYFSLGSCFYFSLVVEAEMHFCGRHLLLAVTHHPTIDGTTPHLTTLHCSVAHFTATPCTVQPWQSNPILEERTGDKFEKWKHDQDHAKHVLLERGFS